MVKFYSCSLLKSAEIWKEIEGWVFSPAVVKVAENNVHTVWMLMFTLKLKLSSCTYLLHVICFK